MTICHLDENPDRFIFTSFPEYVAANVELASGIAGTLSDYVAYGEAKQKTEEFTRARTAEKLVSPFPRRI